MQGSSLSCCPKRPGRGRGRRRGCRTKWDCIEAGHHRVAPGLHVQEPQVLVVLGVGELHHCVIWLPSNSSIGLPRRRCTRNCERMAAPGAWKADADTSGATSPPPSSWVGHAGIGNCVNQRSAMRESDLVLSGLSSAADGDPVDISTQFTLCLQPRAPDFIYFSNSLP